VASSTPSTPTAGSRAVSRRALLKGGTSAAVAGMLLSTDDADAASADDPWTPAVVTDPPASGAVGVTALDSGEQVEVDLDSDTAVRADLSSGNSIMVEGDSRPDGSIAAKRVVRAVFGQRSDAVR
jgi:hypothetical protein